MYCAQVAIKSTLCDSCKDIRAHEGHTRGVYSWVCRLAKKKLVEPRLLAVKKATPSCLQAASYWSSVLKGAEVIRTTSKPLRNSGSGMGGRDPGSAAIFTKGFISRRVAALASATLCTREQFIIAIVPTEDVISRY